MVKPIPNRLIREQLSLLRDPIPNIAVHRPNQSQFYFCMYDMEGDYQGGYYYGLIKVDPINFPLTPPKLSLITPSCRFVPMSLICTSFSSYHPQSWSPHWTIRSILIGLMSFMYDNSDGVGSMAGTSQERKTKARESWNWNMERDDFRRMFGGLKEQIRVRETNRTKSDNSVQKQDCRLVKQSKGVRERRNQKRIDRGNQKQVNMGNNKDDLQQSLLTNVQTPISYEQQSQQISGNINSHLNQHFAQQAFINRQIGPISMVNSQQTGLNQQIHIQQIGMAKYNTPCFRFIIKLAVILFIAGFIIVMINIVW